MKFQFYILFCDVCSCCAVQNSDYIMIGVLLCLFDGEIDSIRMYVSFINRTELLFHSSTTYTIYIVFVFFPVTIRNFILQLQTRLKKVLHDLQEEKEMNKCLLRNQDDWKKQVLGLETEMKSFHSTKDKVIEITFYEEY